MSDLITVQGVVLSAMPVGEYDRRIVLLTRERGKISAFAKGARRPNSSFLAACNPFVFGEFTLYEGRNSYNLNQVTISYQFSDLAFLQPGVYYGYYFLELADYFGREGMDEKEMMNLLYLTVKALLNPDLDDRLIRCIYELRTLTEQGLMPQVFQCVCCGRAPGEEEEVFFSRRGHGIICRDCRKKGEYSDAGILSSAALYTIRFIVTAPLKKLYTFSVKKEILRELEKYVSPYMAANTDKGFRSLGILEQMLKYS